MKAIRALATDLVTGSFCLALFENVTFGTVTACTIAKEQIVLNFSFYGWRKCDSVLAFSSKIFDRVILSVFTYRVESEELGAVCIYSGGLIVSGSIEWLEHNHLVVTQSCVHLLLDVLEPDATDVGKIVHHSQSKPRWVAFPRKEEPVSSQCGGQVIRLTWIDVHNEWTAENLLSPSQNDHLINSCNSLRITSDEFTRG